MKNGNGKFDSELSASQVAGSIATKDGNGKAENFEAIPQSDVPKGRDGKHKHIVERLLREIGQLKAGMAMKIPLVELPDTKENIRAALSRAANRQNIAIATSSNEHFLYVWKQNDAKIEDRWN